MKACSEPPKTAVSGQLKVLLVGKQWIFFRIYPIASIVKRLSVSPTKTILDSADILWSSLYSRTLKQSSILSSCGEFKIQLF